MSEALPARLYLAVALGLLGCGPEQPRAAAAPLPALSVAEPKAPREAEVPAPCAAESTASEGDAEEVLRERLSAPAVFYVEALTPESVPCRPEAFSPFGNGVDYKRNPDYAPYVLQAGTLQRRGLVLAHEGVHGYSPDAMLIEGARWFFSQATCLAKAKPCAVRDFAAEFWQHEPVYFLPLRDTAGVICEEVRIEPRKHSDDFDAELDPKPGLVALHYMAFGKQYQANLFRTNDGLVCGIDGLLLWPNDMIPGGVSHRATVHGRGADSFSISGSPWFFSEDACKARAPDVKPVNFRDFAMGALKLGIEYFVVRDGPKGQECHRLQLFDENEPTARLIETGPQGVEQRQFDVYGEGGLTFWLGPVLTPSLTAEARYRGRLLPAKQMKGAMRVGSDVWYESERVCKAHARSGAAKAPSSSGR